jgi:hypothetical protein
LPRDHPDEEENPMTIQQVAHTPAESTPSPKPDAFNEALRRVSASLTDAAMTLAGLSDVTIESEPASGTRPVVESVPLSARLDIATRLREQIGWILIGLGKEEHGDIEIVDALKALAELAQDIDSGDAFKAVAS